MSDQDKTILESITEILKRGGYDKPRSDDESTEDLRQYLALLERAKEELERQVEENNQLILQKAEDKKLAEARLIEVTANHPHKDLLRSSKLLQNAGTVEEVDNLMADFDDLARTIREQKDALTPEQILEAKQKDEKMEAVKEKAKKLGGVK